MANRTNHYLAAGAVQNAVIVAWAATLNATTFKLVPENASVDQLPGSGQNYARLNLRPAGAYNRGLGRNGDDLRGTGLVIVQVFIRAGGGTFAAHQAADALDKLSNTGIASGDAGSSMRVTFRVVEPPRYSGDSDGWHQFNITIPYFWDSMDAKTFTPTP